MGRRGAWDGEHGILGVKGSSYLPKRHMPSEIVGSMQRAFEGGEESKENGTASPQTLRDSGDFCRFIEGVGQLYVGTPSNAAVCAGICEMIGTPPLRTLLQPFAPLSNHKGVVYRHVCSSPQQVVRFWERWKNFREV